MNNSTIVAGSRTRGSILTAVQALQAQGLRTGTDPELITAFAQQALSLLPHLVAAVKQLDDSDQYLRAIRAGELDGDELALADLLDRNTALWHDTPLDAPAAPLQELGLEDLARVLGCAHAHIDDIESGLQDGTYLASDNEDLPLKQKAYDSVNAWSIAAMASAGLVRLD